MSHEANFDAPMVFDEDAIKVILEETGLPLVAAATTQSLLQNLEEIAREHYWNELSRHEHSENSGDFTFESVADASVTPSRLRDRLILIKNSAERVFAGTSRRPFSEKLKELLKRLGLDKDGKPLKNRGTKLPGHSGSERAAIWLCLVRAVTATEKPPNGYRRENSDRPWSSQKLGGTIQTLSRCIRSTDDDQKNANAAARAIEQWARWCIPNVEQLVASDKVRHRNNTPLDATLSELAKVYTWAVGKTPSFHLHYSDMIVSDPDPWEGFLL